MKAFTMSTFHISVFFGECYNCCWSGTVGFAFYVLRIAYIYLVDAQKYIDWVGL